MRACFLAFALVVAVSTALAEGPGTRIRTTPEVPQPTTLATPDARDTGADCERLRDKQRERCLQELRQAGIERKGSGPEATGMGSGASSGLTSGTTGGPSLGPGAPR